MKRKPVTFTLFLIAVVLFSTVALGAVIGEPDIDGTLADDTVAPGEETTVDVVLVNSGTIKAGSTSSSQKAEVTTARGLFVDLRDGNAPISVQTSKQAVGTFPEGTTEASFDISVDENAKPGTYSIPVELDYEYTRKISDDGGVHDERSVTKTVTVRLKVSDEATFDVVSVDSNARVGSSGTVAVTVENTGKTAATDASVILESRSEELTVGGAKTGSRYVEAWEPGEQRTFRYRIGSTREAEPEPYEFGLSVEFDDDNGVRKTSTGSAVGVSVAPEQEFSLTGIESTVPIGASGTYSVTLRNDGPIPVRFATVTLTSESSDVTFARSKSTTQFVGDWAPGETRTVRVEANASENAEERLYALAASVAYQDPEGDAEVDEEIPLGLQPLPEQSFDLSDVEATLQAGDEGRLRMTLTNTGERDIRNVVLNWRSDHSNLSPQETQYAVGDLPAGESTTVEFGVDVSDSADAGPRQFDFEASFRDSEGDRRESDTLEVRAEVGPSVDEFTVDSRNTTVAPGQTRTIDLTVTNDKDVVLTDISAKLFADSPISVDDDEAFIPSLEPGESATIRFGVSASGGAMAKSYPVSLDFQYEEPDGDTPISDTYQVPVTVTTSGDGGGGLPIVAIGAVILLVVLGVAGYSRFR